MTCNAVFNHSGFLKKFCIETDHCKYRSDFQLNHSSNLDCAIWCQFNKLLFESNVNGWWILTRIFLFHDRSIFDRWMSVRLGFKYYKIPCMVALSATATGEFMCSFVPKVRFLQVASRKILPAKRYSILFTLTVQKFYRFAKGLSYK